MLSADAGMRRIPARDLLTDAEFAALSGIARAAVEDSALVLTEAAARQMAHEPDGGSIRESARTLLMMQLKPHLS